MSKLLSSGLPPFRNTFGRSKSVRHNPAEVDIQTLLLQLRRHRTHLNRTIVILDRLAKPRPPKASSRLTGQRAATRIALNL